MRRTLALIVICLASVVAAPLGADAAEPVVHVVKAGSEIPDGGSEPFNFTAYYPSRLQVHSGDVVQWDFPGGYNGWHSVTFSDPGGEPQPAWRTDEYAGFLALDENWLFGPERGDESVQCGRGDWNGLPAQNPCRLDQSALSTHFSSSIWDRFFSTPFRGSFSAEVDLPPGSYDYHCRLHFAMTGTIEVLPETAPLENPTPEEVDAEVRRDYEAGKALFDELNDPARAREGDGWVVQVGAETDDDRVEIYQFLPTNLPIAPGEPVRFVAGTSEPNSVAFPVEQQGGFNLGGDCDPDSCQGNPPGAPVGVPWGTTGMAFPWACEYDEANGGAPGVFLGYTAPRLHQRTTQFGIHHGCRSAGGVKGAPEMLVAPWMASPIAAPANVVGPGTVHISGAMFDTEVPDWFRRDPRGGHFPDTFEASFPTPGTFAYACLNHEYMKGTITVG